jgi:hypothetical protein
MYDFNEDGLLCQWHSGEPVYIWTYSTFEEYTGESISPSMYEYMAHYVLNHLDSDNPESEAVESYYSLGEDERYRLSEQMLINLGVRKNVADSKVSAAFDALLDIDETSPIAHEYVVFLRGLVQKYSLEARKWTDQIHEEEIKH